VSFRFWQRWLQGVGAGSALFGLFLFFAPSSEMLATYDQHVVEAFHGQAAPPAAFEHQRWALSVIGSSIVGWGLMLLAIATVPFGRREPWAWCMIALSVAAWAALDSFVSDRAGVHLEVLFNGTVAIVVALPLAMTYRAFFRRGAAGVGRDEGPRQVGPRRLSDARRAERRGGRAR
jgi:hypothetical protein